MIYMTHPKYGAMHVYLEAEAVENEKNGWIRGKQDEGRVVEVVPNNTLSLKRGPGRPKKEG